MGRATQGVKLIDLRGTDEIAAVTKVEHEDEEEVEVVEPVETSTPDGTEAPEPVETPTENNDSVDGVEGLNETEEENN